LSRSYRRQCRKVGEADAKSVQHMLAITHAHTEASSLSSGGLAVADIELQAEWEAKDYKAEWR